MICSNKECLSEFSPKTHNQIYCSDECCKVVTNKKIMDRYYAKKARRNGTDRRCSECGKDLLSRYSDNEICSLCVEKQHKSQLNQLNNRLANVIWA